MSKPLVSLLMAAWQPRPDWLHQAIAGALGQRDCRVELLIVDDGSPEPVAELLRDFDDQRLRTLRVEHSGAAAAKNAGIAASTGDYLRFIDADDLIEPTSTSRLLDLCDGREDVIAYGATMFCDDELRPIWKMTSRVQGDAVKACLLGRFTARPHAFLFPRRVIEATGQWSTEIKVAEDWDFVLRALEHAEVRGTDHVMTYYRRHPQGATSSAEEGDRGANYVLDRYFERHPEERGTKLERQARARTLALIGRTWATHGQRRKGIRLLARAAALDPRAVWVEFRQALPAGAGRLRRRFTQTEPARPSG
ncbi:MAG: glycosyltransferase family 2 protein [Solirubrobacterales bacterium]